jgi:rhodanese-related sulfurtransferase
VDIFNRLFNQPAINQLNPARAEEMIRQFPKPYLLDVRQPEEYKRGHISGAELIPLHELSKKIGRIPKNREIICICETGSRSRAAARHLNAAGYRVNNLKGGMINWARAGLPIKKGMAK